jgi:outer membrane protein OmpA-like peptidoglycan-associated protein
MYNKNNIIIALFVFIVINVNAQKGTTVYYDSSFFELNKLKNINSNSDDYSSVITANHSKMYYTSTMPTKSSGNKAKEQIYLSEFDFNNGEWKKGELLSDVVNETKRNNSAIFLDEKLNKLYIYRDDKNGHGNILESKIENDKFNTPLELSFNSKYHESSLAITNDGNKMFLISELNGGMGKKDIWFTEKQKNGEWGELINLKELNSVEDEEAIHLENDGNLIYFSSKGHNTMGGFDVFKSEKIGGKWSKPVRLDQPVNSEKDDLFYSIINNKSYFSSNRDGNYDIFSYYQKSIKLSKFIPAKQILLNVKIFDKDTKEPVSSHIELVDSDKNAIVSKIDFQNTSLESWTELPKINRFRINVTSHDYMLKTEELFVSDTSLDQKIEKNIYLEKIAKGSKVVLKNIFFDTDKATLRPESNIELDELYLFLVNNEKVSVEISGHTDNVGDDNYNLKLSKMRAESVYNFLINKGITKGRLLYKGYGEKQPIDTNDSDEGKQNNRRTEFKIIDVK